MEEVLASFGRWQLRISICMALLKLPMAWFQFGIIFLAPPTTFWCRKPEDYRDFALDDWLSLIKPFGNETDFNEIMDGCLMRNIELKRDKSLQICKWGFDFERSVFESSIITEWSLICDREPLVALSQSILMFGVLIGNLLFGAFSDKYGRKPVLIICIMLQFSFGLFSAWSPWFEGFLAMRFLMAVANGGTMIASFVLCMEIVTGKWRTMVPILYQIPFGLGNVIMALVAYHYRTWRHFQIALSLLSAPFMIYYWIIPESPRWLMATRQKACAMKILKSASEENKLDIQEFKKKINIEVSSQANKTQKTGINVLCNNTTLRTRSLLLAVNWLLSGITLFGFTQYLGHLGTDIYINVCIAGLIIMPGTLCCIFIVNRFGRKLTIIIFNVFVASCFFCMLLVYETWPQICLAALGVIGLSISTPAFYLYTAELYPTIVRNSGLGLCVMFSRIGSMIAPFIVSLEQFSDYLPLSLLGLFAILQSALMIPLNESEDMLVDNIDDMEMNNLSKESEDSCKKEVNS